MQETTVEELVALVKNFCEERDWDQFHNPKDLAIGISTEANELLDIFRFQNEEQVAGFFRDPKHREHIEEEFADTLFLLLRFAQMNGLDIRGCLERKLLKNSRKYPVEKAKGSNLKYDELTDE